MTFTLPTKFPYEARMRNGEKAIVVGVHPEAGETKYPICGFRGNGINTVWCLNGKVIHEQDECDYDLIGPWEVIEGWYVIKNNGILDGPYEVKQKVFVDTQICRKLRYDPRVGKLMDVTEEV